MLLQSLLRPVLTPLMRGMFDAPIASSSAWSPLSLWPDGIATPGMWISPRDLTSQWADYTGTTPVSVPGTVADSANPVGLALDIRAGAPEVLGPEDILNGDFSADVDWTLTANATISGGKLNINAASGVYENVATQATGGRVSVGKYYLVTLDVVVSTGAVSFFIGELTLEDKVGRVNMTTSGQYSFVQRCRNADNFFFRSEGGFTGSVDNIIVREVPGNHMLQSTSAARPLLSAYDGQTLGPGDTYDSAGYPVFQLYDGVDDGMATAAFSAGTLIDGMDCMIVVRRDAGTVGVAGLSDGTAANTTFGFYHEPDGIYANHWNCGTAVTTWVDGVQLAGGTGTTRATLYAALTAGERHIAEWQNLDLSGWTAAAFSSFMNTYRLNGPRGDILLYPSTTPTADKDAARQWLADYYGVTLP